MNVELLPPIVYLKSLGGMTKQLKVLKMKLTRCQSWQTMKKEELVVRIEKLKRIREEMRLVMHMAAGNL